MAEIAVPRRRVFGNPEVRPERPSRVIALELHAPAGVGNSDFAFTPQLGNRLILYSIDVWAYCSAHAVAIGGFFYIMFGNSVPTGGEDIATRWKEIISVYGGIKIGFRWFDCEAFHRRFTMARLFTTDELRFGVVVENFGPQVWETTIAFEISEG